jgi:aspartate/methionine/tyrosine aminotransferase
MEAIMELPHFALDHWMSKYDFATPPIAFNLASSTGPRWSVADLARWGDTPLTLDDIKLSYAPPQGAAGVRAAVAAFHEVDPDHVVMTTGASEALSILLCLASRPGGNLVIPDPAYPAYAALAQSVGLKHQAYSMASESGFAQDPDAIVAATNSDTVAVILNTPHNPTGVVLARDRIETLAAALAARSIPLIVDEVYHPLYHSSPQRSAAGIPNVIVISDLSKALSLPGLRTGWIIEADAEMREKIINARSYFTISGSPLLEHLAQHALINRHTIFETLRRVADANLALLDAMIDGSAGRITWTRPHGGTTCFPAFADGRDSRPFCQKLAAAGVLIAPGDCFGHASHMRIGFAQQADGFAEAIGRFAAVLAEEGR